MVAGHADRAAFNGGPEKPVFIACLGDLKLDEIISTTTQLSVVMVVSVAVESSTYLLSLYPKQEVTKVGRSNPFHDQFWRVCLVPLFWIFGRESFNI